MAAVTRMANAPLPMLKQLGENTAELRTSWPTRFCSGERARRWRSLVGNGGAAELACGAVEGCWSGEIEVASASGRRAGEFMSWPAMPRRLRRVAARSGDRQRAAHTRRAFSENGRYYSFDSVKTISLTAKIDSVGSLKP